MARTNTIYEIWFFHASIQSTRMPRRTVVVDTYPYGICHWCRTARLMAKVQVDAVADPGFEQKHLTFKMV